MPVATEMVEELGNCFCVSTRSAPGMSLPGPAFSLPWRPHWAWKLLQPAACLAQACLQLAFYMYGPIFMQPWEWVHLLTFCTLDRHPLCLTLVTTLTSVNFLLMLSFYLHVTLCLSFTAMSRAVVPQCGLKSAVPPPPGNLLEMQGLRAQLRPAESETLGAETSRCAPLQVIQMQV